MKKKQHGSTQSAHHCELKKAKETVKHLEKEIATLKKTYHKDLAILIEEAYMAGYSDAIVDFDKKAESMEKFLHEALKEFEKSYRKNLFKSPKKNKAKKSKK